MLTLRSRAGWLAHLYKASVQQHHRELEAAFRPHIPVDGVIFDVGAHAGQFSKLFARMAPQGRVFAFEPSAYARSILRRALAWNRIGHVEIVPLGLSDAASVSTLTTPIKRRGGVGFGLAHLGEHQAGGETYEQTVELTTLDDFFGRRGLARLDFVKADIEGWETHMLRGGINTIAARRPALFLEINEQSLARAGSTPAAIWALLEPLGYRALMAPGFAAVTQFSGAADYLFLAE
jgi:FkbM family methyltransferase